MAQYLQQQTAEVDALIYKLQCYRDPQRVRNDVVELLRNTPSLQPRSGALARGPKQVVTIYLVGTVPIFYNGAQYNIPVNIWVIESYPFSPPVCYVTPTPGMIIKPKHRHVDSTGMCYLPYLSNWNPNSHNLMGLVGTLVKVFGQDPPVRSQAPVAPTPTNNPASPIPGPSPNYNQQPYTQPTQSPPPQLPQQPQLSQPTSSQQPGGSKPFEDPATVSKRNALINLTSKVHERVHIFNVQTTKEMDELIAQSADLEAKAVAMAAEKSRLEEDKNKMDADFETITRNTEELSKWLTENTSSSTIEIDAVTEPKDVISKQLLYLVAEEASIEDTMYYLEKKIISGNLDVETFLKAVRSLSTEQFIKRATIKKIHEKQRGR